MRFSELRSAVGGISQKMLTTTLRGLERDGFVYAHRFPTIPPRVDYELTDLGRELLEPVTALGEWARQNTGAGQCSARARFDASRRIRHASSAAESFLGLGHRLRLAVGVQRHHDEIGIGDAFHQIATDSAAPRPRPSASSRCGRRA